MRLPGSPYPWEELAFPAFLRAYVGSLVPSIFTLSPPAHRLCVHWERS